MPFSIFTPVVASMSMEPLAPLASTVAFWIVTAPSLFSILTLPSLAVTVWSVSIVMSLAADGATSVEVIVTAFEASTTALPVTSMVVSAVMTALPSPVVPARICAVSWILNAPVVASNSASVCAFTCAVSFTRMSPVAVVTFALPPSASTRPGVVSVPSEMVTPVLAVSIAFADAVTWPSTSISPVFASAITSPPFASTVAVSRTLTSLFA